MAVNKNGLLILSAPGREGYFRANTSHQLLKRVIQWLMRALMGQWGNKKSERKCLLSHNHSEASGSKCRTKWLLNKIETTSWCLCAASKHLYLSTVIAARVYAWKCRLCEAMKLTRTNLLMGAHSIRDTYTTQPGDNANRSSLLVFLFQGGLLSWRAKWSISRWSVNISGGLFFFQREK